MAEWTACNSCAIGASETTLVLTTCYHIFCSPCFRRGKCPLCNIVVQSIEINKNLPPHLLQLFQDPKDREAENHRLVARVIEFQSFHEANLLELDRKSLVDSKRSMLKRIAEVDDGEKMKAAKYSLESRLMQKKVQCSQLEKLIAKEEREMAQLKHEKQRIQEQKRAMQIRKQREIPRFEFAREKRPKIRREAQHFAPTSSDIFPSFMFESPTPSSMRSSSSSTSNSLENNSFFDFNFLGLPRSRHSGSSRSSTSSSYRSDEPLF